MMKFIGGPAAGKVIAIKRTPIVLRVTFNGKDFDALNNPQDQAKRNEQLHVYILAARPDVVFIRPGGAFPMGEYHYSSMQPEDEVMRDNARWGKWCDENIDALMPEWAKKSKEVGRDGHG